jgi:hypothetical protein
VDSLDQEFVSPAAFVLELVVTRHSRMQQHTLTPR